MKRMMVAAAIVALTGTMAIAQGSGGSGGAGGGTSAGTAGGIGNAPVGHRQPRRSTFENEAAPKTNNGIGQVDPADAELDRKIKSICRGC
ncbi:hypothetical protein [Rhodopseudomonas sp. B29]|uniref:hypothetical protein n=1 Tax=Rhodopseudomonas sp. B29 TaxID=95607 RepID=UPI000349D4C7|nr:hypothetical protein [Rhodopseudomonas sp. B29]